MTSVKEAIAAACDDARQARNQGQLDQAGRYYARAAAMARVAGEHGALAHALRHVSDIAREQGDTQLALEAGEEAVALYRPGSSTLDLANALRLNALALQDFGSEPLSVPLWAEARTLYLAEGVQAGVGECDRRLKDLTDAPLERRLADSTERPA